MIASVLAITVSLLSSSLFTSAFQDRCETFVCEYWGAEKLCADYKAVLSRQNPDGSFQDVNYKSDRRVKWPAAKHVTNMKVLASAWYIKRDSLALGAYRKALDYWLTDTPVSLNWWWSTVSIPQNLAPGIILLKRDLPEEDIKRSMKIFDMAFSKRADATGRNKTWVEGNLFMCAVISENEALAFETRNNLASELTIREWEDGLQPDYTFHQHGPQLQIGNYGLGFVKGLAVWAKALAGTPFAFPEDKMDILNSYLKECLLWVVYKDYFDFNACGRRNQKGKQSLTATIVKEDCERLGVDYASPEGAKYYPYSDFGVFRTDDWYASIRMQSERTIGFEVINSENTQGYFSADGALLVRRDGDEYEDIAGEMNWKHIPGATTYDNGKPLNGVDRKGPYNMTPLVFGKAGDGLMACAMELKRDGLSARKAWFFTKDMIVCLGCGITMEGNYPVHTTLGQCKMDGDVKIGKKYVSHRGVTWVVLDGAKIIVAPADHSGNWKTIVPTYPDKITHQDLFEAYINHREHPKNASYQYVVVPTGISGASAEAKVLKTVKVLSNTVEKQSVRIGNITMTIDWNNAEIYL